MVNDLYSQYLQTLHVKKQTPDEVIADFVREGMGKEMVGKRKIVAGEVNEVYEIDLSDHSQVILRISPNGSPDFQQEQWAIKECIKVGIPAPEIFLIKYQIINEIEYGFCLMERVEGDTLERGKIKFGDLSLEERKNYIHQAGVILAKIHSIPTKGWGWIVKDNGQYDNSDELFEGWIEKKAEYEQVGREEDIQARIMNKANAVVEEFKTIYRSRKPGLNHADFGHKHMMVGGGKIVAILDWGSVRSDLPVYDFGSWDFWFGDDIPTQWLKDGYTNKTIFDDMFEDFLHFIRITKGLENLAWYHKQKYSEMVEKIKTKLVSDVGYFM